MPGLPASHSSKPVQTSTNVDQQSQSFTSSGFGLSPLRASGILYRSSSHASAHLTSASHLSKAVGHPYGQLFSQIAHSTHSAIPHSLSFSCFHVHSQSSFPVPPLPLPKRLHYIQCLDHDSAWFCKKMRYIIACTGEISFAIHFREMNA